MQRVKKVGDNNKLQERQSDERSEDMVNKGPVLSVSHQQTKEIDQVIPESGITESEVHMSEDKEKEALCDEIGMTTKG